MSKFTEQDVVTYLENKVAYLRKELVKTQEILALFVEMLGPAPVNITAVNSRDMEATSAEVIPAKKRGRKSSLLTSTGVQAPASYDASLTFAQKVAYVLTQLGPANKSEILKLINDLDPDADPKKLERDLTIKLSSMFRNGLIKAEKIDKKYTYSL